MNIPFTLGNVSEVAVSPINADATLAAGGAGNRMVFGGVVVAGKGKPFEVIQVNESNWMSVLGKPFHGSKGAVAESLRQVSEATRGGAGVVVRVVPESYRYPAITLNLYDPIPEPETHKPETLPAKGKAAKSAKTEADYIEPAAAPTVSIVTTALAHGSKVESTVDTAVSFWTVDGSESNNRSVAMAKADVAMYGEGMWQITLTESDNAGNETELESQIVSLDLEAMDDMGRPAFIETVLESRSKYLRAELGPRVAELTDFPKTAFVGGTGGDLTTLSAGDYLKGIAILSSTVTNYTAVCSLGVYEDEAIRALAAICDNRRIGGFIDIDPRLNYADALTKATDLALNNGRITLCYLPFDYKDGFYGNRTVCGISGIAFTAKARGVAKTFPVGGWHYTPAGEERAIISRSALRVLDGAGEPDYEAMYKARINKVSSTSTGLLFIDDSLTTSVRENYLRFEQVVSVADAISRDFYNLANGLKHQPDGVTFTGLIDGMTDILDGYVANGALVSPRDPEDGKEPYVLTIEQTDIDAWKCRWAICVTGSGRRFLGEPVLIR